MGDIQGWKVFDQSTSAWCQHSKLWSTLQVQGKWQGCTSTVLPPQMFNNINNGLHLFTTYRVPDTAVGTECQRQTLYVCEWVCIIQSSQRPDEKATLQMGKLRPKFTGTNGAELACTLRPSDSGVCVLNCYALLPGVDIRQEWDQLDGGPTSNRFPWSATRGSFTVSESNGSAIVSYFFFFFFQMTLGIFRSAAPTVTVRSSKIEAFVQVRASWWDHCPYRRDPSTLALAPSYSIST